MEQVNKFDSELANFDPQIAELTKIANTAREISLTDYLDRSQVKVVHDKRMELKQLRVTIAKTGKALRDDANRFNKAVLDKEKELIGVIEPEEKRLQELEDEADRLAEVEKRKADLPNRKQRLSEIGDTIEITDEGILDMDDTSFDAYVNQRVANWNIKQKEMLEQQRAEAEEKARVEEAARIKREEEARIEAEAKAKAEQEKIDAQKAKLEEERKKLEDEKRELEHQKELEAARKEAEEKAKKEAAEKAEADRLAAIEAEKKAKEEAEAKAKAEADKLAAEKKYQEFLAKAGYSEKTKDDFYLVEDSEQVIIYKKVGVYKK